jgi:DNA-binding winged helix-turn-helix (wHTH) protein/tetratricopeptide (TPR) repeat protein
MKTRSERTKDLAERSRFILGDLQVHPDRGCVVRDGKDIPLEPRQMEVLVALAEKAGKVMSSSELQLEVWKTDRHGENPIDGENAVSKTLSVLRSALDQTDSSRYIETLRGRGYRLKPAVAFPSGYRRLSKTAQRWTHGSPFVGLAAFDAEHAPVFAGRTQATAELLDAMRGQIDNGRRFILIAGSSGCGKTSLLHAGALPLLTADGGFDGLRALDFATCDLAAAQSGDVMLPLANALSRWMLGKRPVFAQQSIESFRQELIDRPDAIAPAIAEAFRRFPERELDAQPHAHLLLVIDHAEALVTRLCDPQVRIAFERALCALCDAPRTLVAMIVRSDYAPDLAQAVPLLTERKTGGGHLDVLAPKPGEIAEIIREPARQASLEFDADAESQLLDDTLRDAANGQPDALPLLQHTLQLLYERRAANGTLTWSAYREIGGLEGAIAHRAEEVFASLPAEAQHALDTVLAKLVVIQSDSDAVTARRTRLDALQDSARTLVDAFVAGRLFVSALHDGQPHFGVVHEALLRQWPRAVEWVQENRRLLMAKARLIRAANRWNEEGRAKDHLLNPGRPLAEALEVAARFPEDIDDDLRRFLRQSEKESLRKRRTRRVAMVSLFALTMLSLAFAVVALLAMDEAQQRERESRRLTDFLLGPLADELRRREMLPVLGQVGSEAIAYLQQRDPDDLGPPEMARTARAYRTLGEALFLANKQNQAEASFKRARAIANMSLNIDNMHPASLFERGQTFYWLGYMDYTEKRYEDAGTHWNRYLHDSMLLISTPSKNPGPIMEVSYAENLLGTIALRQGNTDSAMRHFERSLARKKEAASIDRDNLDYQFEYIDTLSWIASTFEASGNLSEASGQYDLLIEMLYSLIRENKTANRWWIRLANYMMLSATLEIGLADHKKANARALEAVRILEQLSQFSPMGIEVEKDLAKARIIYAETAGLLSDHATESTHLKSVLATTASLDPKTRSQISWAWVDARARMALAMLRTDASALTEADLAIADLHRLAKDNRINEISESHAHALLLRGNLHARRGNRALANGDWRSATTAIEALPRKGNAYRTWIWAQAMRRIAPSEDTATARQWLASIGYARRSID